MALSDLLLMYHDNTMLRMILSCVEINPTLFVRIEGKENGYKVESKPAFNFAAKTVTIFMDNNFRLIYKNCGCLEFYKKQECIHIVCLYATALKILNSSLYKKEYEEYQRRLWIREQSNILNKLTGELKTSNSYFGMIHLYPVVEIEGGAFYLSLKIGTDKIYVVKNISFFIHCMENNVEYSYGQRLSFTHSYECLDDISKEFYSFLMNICGEGDTKSILLRKSQLLKILEIYHQNEIYIKEEDARSISYFIASLEHVDIILNQERLFIACPNQSKPLVCGVNRAYFIEKGKIYAYMFQNRKEAKIVEYLFKMEKGIGIEANSSDFIANLLPLIKDSISIQDDFYERYPIPKIEIDSFIFYENNTIVLKYKMEYDQSLDNPYLKQVFQGYEDILNTLSFQKESEGIYTICGLDKQYRFLVSDLSVLKSFGKVYFDDSIKKVKPKKSGKFQIRVSYNVGLLDFEIENETLTMEELQALLKGYRLKKNYIQLKDNSILKIDEEQTKEIDNFLEDYNISIQELNQPIHKPLNYVLKMVEVQDKNLSIDDSAYQIIQAIQNYKQSKFTPVEPFPSFLRQYQLEGYRWLKTLALYGLGGILADDMGLGKTLEMISFIASDEKQMPSLIVCPMSLVYNWEYECQKWGISFPVRLIIGLAEERQKIIEDISSSEKRIYITSYDSLRRDYEFYRTEFRFVIADEAQFIKNQYAQKSEAIKSISSQIRFALTGTPIENGLADLWSIFDFLMSGYLGNYTHFKQRYERWIMEKDTEALTRLQKRVNPFILRRIKNDVLKDLPDKMEDYYFCSMSEEQRRIYEGYVRQLKEELVGGGNRVLALLTRLRQICITPELIYQEHFENTKIDTAVELIQSSIENNHRILVFSQFAQSFPILSKILEQKKIRHFVLDGQTKATMRRDMVQEFNQNEEIKVFIISLKAGGTGLNLIGADMVIHLDPWWNYSAEIQATDRAYRIGQTKSVYVIRLICKNTIEEKVVRLQEAKKDLAERIVQSDSSTMKLSKKDILELLD